MEIHYGTFRSLVLGFIQIRRHHLLTPLAAVTVQYNPSRGLSVDIEPASDIVAIHNDSLHHTLVVAHDNFIANITTYQIQFFGVDHIGDPCNFSPAPSNLSAFAAYLNSSDYDRICDDFKFFKLKPNLSHVEI
jgi:hypothetical protein